MACPAWPGGSCLHHSKRSLSLSTPQAQTSANITANKVLPVKDPADKAPGSEARCGTSAGANFDDDDDGSSNGNNIFKAPANVHGNKGQNKQLVKEADEEAYAGVDSSSVESDTIVAKKRNLSDDLQAAPYAAAPLTRRARAAPNHFNVPSTWQFVRVLGSGVSGFVAAYKVDGQDCAVKKIPGVFSSPARALRILREVKLLKHLNHFNIVRLHELYFEGPSFEDIYLRMELLESNLTHFISVFRHALSEHQLLCILFQLLRALCCMHTAQILHRDVKPDNVLLTGSGHIKLADLGLSRAVSAQSPDDEEPLLTACVVSQFYRAPEVALHPQKYSFPIDIWSVGCIFAELISLEVLFKGKDSLDQVRQIVTVLGMPKLDDIDWIPKESAARGFLNLCHGPNNGRAFNELLDAADSKLGGNSDATYLLRGMLEFHPDKRPTSKEALFSPCMHRFAAGQDPSVAIALDTAPADCTWEREFTTPGNLDILAFRKAFLAMRAAPASAQEAGQKQEPSAVTGTDKAPQQQQQQQQHPGTAQTNSPKPAAISAAPKNPSPEVETPEKTVQKAPHSREADVDTSKDKRGSPPPVAKRESRSSSQTYSFLFPTEGSETKQSSRKERSDTSRSQHPESSPQKCQELKPRQRISTGGVSITRRSTGSVVSLNLEGKGIRTVAHNKAADSAVASANGSIDNVNNGNSSDSNVNGSSGKVCSANNAAQPDAGSSNLSSNDSSKSISSSSSIAADQTRTSKDAAPVKRRTVQVNLPPEGLRSLQSIHRSICSNNNSNNSNNSTANNSSSGSSSSSSNVLLRSPLGSSGSGEGSNDSTASSRQPSDAGLVNNNNKSGSQRHSARCSSSSNSARHSARNNEEAAKDDDNEDSNEDYGLSPSRLFQSIYSSTASPNETSKTRSNRGNLINGKIPIAADAPGRAKRESLLSASSIVTMITQATQGGAYPFGGTAAVQEECPRSPTVKPRRSTPSISARSSSSTATATSTTFATGAVVHSKTSVANFI